MESLDAWHPTKYVNEILPGVFVTSYDEVCNVNNLKRLGITHILNVADECDP